MCYLMARNNLGTTHMMNDIEKMDFVPKTRLRREWRKWVRKIKEGAEVYETRCGQEPRQIMLFTNEEWEWLMQEIERPPSPLSDVMKRAIALHDLMSIPEPWEKDESSTKSEHHAE